MYVFIENDDINNYREKNVLLFGAGSCGLKCIEEFEKVKANILGFLDNNKDLHGKRIKGYRIWSIDELTKFEDAFIMITSTFSDSIEHQLKDMGYTNFRTVKVGALKDTLPKEEFFKEFLSNEEANQYIYERLMKDAPFFVGRFGSVELECLVSYYYLLDRVNRKDSPYHDNLKWIMNEWAGFFPTEDERLDEFAKMYIEDAKQIDLMWNMWLSRFENQLYKEHIPDKPLALYYDTAFPIDIKNPWTRALEGKRVLIIHPFKESIENNYCIKDKLFENKEFLPDFELITLKAVQSIANTKTEFNTWFDALEHMEKQIAQIDFDIALIGAGAYGFPLAAYIKRIGKKAVHIGGMLQLFFGIKGKAWNEYGFYNEYWTLPLESERPEGYKKVENGRYW